MEDFKIEKVKMIDVINLIAVNNNNIPDIIYRDVLYKYRNNHYIAKTGKILNEHYDFDRNDFLNEEVFVITPKDKIDSIDFMQVGYVMSNIYQEICNGIEKAFKEKENNNDKSNSKG